MTTSVDSEKAGGRGGGIWPVLTSKPVATSSAVAAFGGGQRPAACAYFETVSRRTPSRSSISRKDNLARTKAKTSFCFPIFKTFTFSSNSGGQLPSCCSMRLFYPKPNSATLSGRFSGGHDWPLLRGRRGHQEQHSLPMRSRSSIISNQIKKRLQNLSQNTFLK
jgi:hypothetical protein